jgi:hypothetical protein
LWKIFNENCKELQINETKTMSEEQKIEKYKNEEYKMKNINFNLGATAAIVTSMGLIAGLAQSV